MPRAKPKNASYKLTRTEISKFENALKSLGMTKKVFCEQHNISYNTLRSGLSTFKIPQKVAVVISDFVSNPEQLELKSIQIQDDVFTIAKTIAPALYDQITNPDNAFLTLTHTNGELLAEVTNNIVKDIALNVVSVVGLEDKQSGEYITVIIVKRKDRNKLLDACKKYVDNIEVE